MGKLTIIIFLTLPPDQTSPANRIAQFKNSLVINILIIFVVNKLIQSKKMKNQINQQSECCPPFHPEDWDHKLFEWKDKLFVRQKVKTFFFMPVNFGPVMRRMDSIIRSANGHIVDGLVLSDHASRWNMDVYIAVNMEIPGACTTSLNGTYYCKVYEGNFKETGVWCKDFEEHAKNKGFSIEKWFMWYTTCPKCAKKYGKNYVAIFAKVN